MALEWGAGNRSFNKALCGTKDQASLGNTIHSNECVLWVRELLQVSHRSTAIY